MVDVGKTLSGEAVTLMGKWPSILLLEQEGVKLNVTAAVSDTLTMSVLLGTDVPEMPRLLGMEPG